MDSNRSDPAASWLLSPLGQQATGDMKKRWLENASDACARINTPVVATIPELGLTIDFSNRTVTYDRYNSHIAGMIHGMQLDIAQMKDMIDTIMVDINTLKSQISNPELFSVVTSLEDQRDKLVAEISELKSRVDIEFLTSLE